MATPTPFKKTSDIFFKVQNINPEKTIRLFGIKILSGEIYDLLSVTEISESDIRISLLKGEIYSKIKSGDIIVIDSNIDLLQFSSDQRQFLTDAGILCGTHLNANEIDYDDSSLPNIGATNLQTAVDYCKSHLSVGTQNKLRVGKSGAIDYTSIAEAVNYAISQGASETNAWEIIIDPGEYTEPPMNIVPGISLSNDHAANMGVVSVVAQNPNSDLFTCSGGHVAGIKISGVTNPLKYLFNCSTPNSIVNIHGISIGKCSNGIIVYNGAKASISELYVCVTKENEDIGTVITLAGANSFSCVKNSNFFAPAGILPLYTTNPIQRCISLNDNTHAFISNCVFSVASKDNTSDCIYADGYSLGCVTACDFSNNAIATRVGSVGNNTQLVLQSCSFSDNLFNGKTDSATGSIFVNVSADQTNYTGVDGATLAGIVQFQDEKTIKLIGDLKYRYISGAELDLPTFLTDNSSTGVNTGGVLTKSGILSINVSAGNGWIKRDAPYNDTFGVMWGAKTNLSLTPYSNNYIVYDLASTSIISQLSAPGNTQIKFGEIETDSDIRYIHALRTPLASIEEKVQQYLLATRKLALNNGVAITNGTSAKKISVGIGSYYLGIDLINYSGSGTDGYFSYYYGTDGYTEISNINEIDDLQYDNSGVLTELSDGYYKTDILYLTSDGRLSLIYGNFQVGTLEEAQAAAITLPPTFIRASAFSVAKIIVKKNNGIIEFMDIREQPAKPGGTGTTYVGIVDHDLLFNLDHDSHLQYLPANGTRNMTGNLSLGGNNIVSVGMVDGVDVSGHASRHLPGGIDALSVGTPVVVLAGSAPSEGDSNSFARRNHQHGIAIGAPNTIGTTNISGAAVSVSASDHVHAHGNQTDGYLHAQVIANGTSGFMSGADKAKLDRINVPRYYGMFSSSTTQVVTGASIATLWTYDTTEITNGIHIDPIVSSRIVFENPAVYRIGYSAQIYKTSGGRSEIAIWAAFNGSIIPRSASYDVVDNTGRLLPYVSFIINAAANDYIEFYFSSDDATAQIINIPATTGPTRPGAPSVIIDVEQIS